MGWSSTSKTAVQAAAHCRARDGVGGCEASFRPELASSPPPPPPCVGLAAALTANRFITAAASPSPVVLVMPAARQEHQAALLVRQATPAAKRRRRPVPQPAARFRVVLGGRRGLPACLMMCAGRPPSPEGGPSSQGEALAAPMHCPLTPGAQPLPAACRPRSAAACPVYCANRPAALLTALAARWGR